MQGLDYLLIEQDQRVGGRVGSFYDNGYIFDLGFQVYNSAYFNTNAILDIDELDLRYFKPGAVVHDGGSFQMISDPLRDISKIFSTIFSDLTTIKDKIKILSLKYSLSDYQIDQDQSKDLTTLEFLEQYGFSDKFIKNFFMPFFSGIFLENKLETSSKFFKYVFSNFNNGLAALPRKGMQAIPDQLLNKLDGERVIIGQSVVNIDDSKNVTLDDGIIIKGNRLILSGDSTNLVDGENGEYNAVKTMYFSTQNDILNGEYIHLYPKDNIINNVAIPTYLSEAYSKNSDHLISLTILESENSETEMVKDIQGRLSKYYGGGPNTYEFLRSINIKTGTLRQPKGYFNRSQKNSEDNIYMIGEKVTNGSIEGAVLAGLNIIDEF
tara:strand:- start:1503 stop:2642 length:1140 start_codon:yes stop_codon:yes gene_type:complete